MANPNGNPVYMSNNFMNCVISEHRLWVEHWDMLKERIELGEQICEQLNDRASMLLKYKKTGNIGSGNTVLTPCLLS